MPSHAQELVRGRFLRLVSRDGWEYLDRLGATGVVMAAAVTDAGELLLVEQERTPIGGPVIELPAGLVGDAAEDPHSDPDETHLAAAEREVEEETGFRSRTPERARVLFEGPASAGSSTERVAVVYLPACVRVGAGGGVGVERITTHVVPLAQVEAFLAGAVARGIATDPRIYAALFALRHEYPAALFGAA